MDDARLRKPNVSDTDRRAHPPGRYERTGSRWKPHIVVDTSRSRSRDARRPGCERRQQIMEIGTGTGYSTAILCERVGDENVVSIEADAHLATRAASAIHKTGHKPTLVTGNGLDGFPPRAPYDRITATCSVRHIPDADHAKQAGRNHPDDAFRLAVRLRIRQAHRWNGRNRFRPAPSRHLLVHAGPSPRATTGRHRRHQGNRR